MTTASRAGAIREVLTGDSATTAQDIKRLVADEIAAVDPHATVHVTDYFNHTFVPDIVVAWNGDKSTRDYYLRFRADSPYLAEDVERLGSVHPAFLCLLPEGSEDVPEETAEAVRAEAQVMVTDTDGLATFAPDDDGGIQDLIAPSLVRGGRGMLQKPRAEATMASVSEGFAALPSGDVEPTRKAVNALRSVLTDDFSRDIEQSMRFVWDANGRDPEDFPGRSDFDENLAGWQIDALLRYLFGSAGHSADPAYWRRLGAIVPTARMLSLGTVAASPNFNSFVDINSDRLRFVSVAHLTVESSSTMSWTLEDEVLVLHGPTFELRFAYDGRKLGYVKHDHEAITSTAFRQRTKNNVVLAVQLDSGEYSSEFVVKQGLDSGLPADAWSTIKSNARVLSAQVRMPDGKSKVVCDFSRRVATAEHTSHQPLNAMLLEAARIVGGMTSAHVEEMRARLAMAGAAAAETSTETDG